MLIQIVPRLPPKLCGIGDYAFLLAKELSKNHLIQTVFIVTDGKQDELVKTMPFRVVYLQSHTEISLVQAIKEASKRVVNCSDVSILVQYDFYQFDTRGCPSWLVNALRSWKSSSSNHKLLIMFHELYTYTVARRREILLRPYQFYLVKRLIKAADACFTNNLITKKYVSNIASTGKVVKFLPVFSTFGEPEISIEEFRNRDPHRWIICGSAARNKKSLNTFLEILGKIPAKFYPNHLDIIGGEDNQEVRTMIVKIKEFQVNFYPRVTSEFASSILRQASFSFLDYSSFNSRKNYPSLIFKSTIFAANSAHGIITVLAHKEEKNYDLGVDFPPFFHIQEENYFLPEYEDLVALRLSLYNWYRECGSLSIVSKSFADFLKKPSKN